MNASRRLRVARASAERAVLVDAEQPHPALRHEVALLVANTRLPHLGRSAPRHWASVCSQPAGPDRADERRAVLQADHPLSARKGHHRRTDGSQRFDDSTVHATVDDAVRLVVLLMPWDRAQFTAEAVDENIYAIGGVYFWVFTFLLGGFITLSVKAARKYGPRWSHRMTVQGRAEVRLHQKLTTEPGLEGRTRRSGLPRRRALHPGPRCRR